MQSRIILLAVAALILGNLFATFADVFVKVLAVESSVFQYIFIRQMIVLLVVIPFFLRQKREYRRLTHFKVYGFRAMLTCIGAPATVIALLYLPLATANMIFYLAPFLTLLMGLFIFKETLHSHRFAVILLGFLGVFVALKPDYIGIEAFYALCTAIAVAGFNISVKWLPRHTNTIITLFWSNLFALPILAALATYHWTPLTTDLLLLCASTSACLIIYQACCIYAFQNAEAGAITIAEYSGLIFAIALGWLLFEEPVDVRTWLGASLIIIPIVWQSVYEYRLVRARTVRKDL